MLEKKKTLRRTRDNSNDQGKKSLAGIISYVLYFGLDFIEKKTKTKTKTKRKTNKKQTNKQTKTRTKTKPKKKKQNKTKNKKKNNVSLRV